MRIYIFFALMLLSVLANGTITDYSQIEHKQINDNISQSKVKVIYSLGLDETLLEAEARSLEYAKKATQGKLATLIFKKQHLRNSYLNKEDALSITGALVKGRVLDKKISENKSGQLIITFFIILDIDSKNVIDNLIDSIKSNSTKKQITVLSEINSKLSDQIDMLETEVNYYRNTKTFLEETLVKSVTMFNPNKNLEHHKVETRAVFDWIENAYGNLKYMAPEPNIEITEYGEDDSEVSINLEWDFSNATIFKIIDSYFYKLGTYTNHTAYSHKLAGNVKSKISAELQRKIFSKGAIVLEVFTEDKRHPFPLITQCNNKKYRCNGYPFNEGNNYLQISKKGKHKISTRVSNKDIDTIKIRFNWKHYENLDSKRMYNYL